MCCLTFGAVFIGVKILFHFLDIIVHIFSSLKDILFNFLAQLPPHYTYLMLGLIITLESTGIPLPAETLLILLSVYAARTHHIAIEGIMAAAIIGAILGDNIGYFIGYRFGYGLLEKHGSKVGLNKDRLMLGRYLFRRFGGVGVFFGRFLAILRIFIALLAGATRMSWWHFTFYNAAGAIIWGGGYTYITYLLGQQIERFTGPIGFSIAGLLLATFIAVFIMLRRHEHQLLEQARCDEERRAKRSKKRRKHRHS